MGTGVAWEVRGGHQRVGKVGCSGDAETEETTYLSRGSLGTNTNSTRQIRPANMRAVVRYIHGGGSLWPSTRSPRKYADIDWTATTQSRPASCSCADRGGRPSKTSRGPQRPCSGTSTMCSSRFHQTHPNIDASHADGWPGRNCALDQDVQVSISKRKLCSLRFLVSW